MEYLKFFGIFIISSLFFTPLDNKYHLRSRYHDHTNKGFRLTVILIALLFLATSILAGLSDGYLIRYPFLKDAISFILTVPLAIILLIAMPHFKDK